MKTGDRVKVIFGRHDGKDGTVRNSVHLVEFAFNEEDWVTEGFLECVPLDKQRDPDADLSSPLQSQVGGDHYRKLVIQPAEYTTRNGLGHLAGDTIAYVTRYKDKGGKQDLEKAIHCLQLLIAIEYPEEAK